MLWGWWSDEDKKSFKERDGFLEVVEDEDVQGRFK
jgi:hypothetical protein